ncbi:MAG: mechanosensitive ion channel family protein [Kiritimatiellia bacterium]
MYHIYITLLQTGRLEDPSLLAAALTAATILLLAFAFLGLVLRFVAPHITHTARKTRFKWDADLLDTPILRMASIWLAGILAQTLSSVWFPAEAFLWQGLMTTLTQLWIIIAATGLIFTLLDGVEKIYQRLLFARQIPIRVFIQIAKLIAFLVALVMAVSALMNRSPALLVSGLGAMTAVLMLIFKDPILGFVAGIQLSANRMLSVGDWLEMPKYNADGDVIEITLTTVKVRNWDCTITTVPTYALISEAFKNWRGMTDAGGRRIKRSIFLDMTSIHFLAPEEIQHLRRMQLITDYIDQKQQEIEADNQAKGIDPASPANGRHLTNIGVLRAYLVTYLKNHTGLRQNMIQIVRQLQPTPQGIPLEIYAFTADTGWVAHEGVQSDIFDHILAVIPEFGLRIYQTPSGTDLLALKRL